MPPRFSRSRDNRIWSFVYVSPTRKNVTLFIVAIQARELQFRRRRSDIVGESRCEGKGDGVLNLTNQRTDAVAMSVLDPVEVAEVEVWVLDLEGKDKVEAKRALAAAEYTVFKRVLDASKLKFVLNEKDIAATARIELPQSYRRRVVPSPIYEARQHRDIRIAQRAATIADLAKIIVERKVQKGLRRTLHFQAIRLEVLANERFHEIGGAVEVETGEDETGDDS